MDSSSESWGLRAVNIDRSSTESPLYLRPFFAPLLFPNESSDARDHCANERTFLSWLRLSVYMAVVSVAIILSFHLRSEPTSVERRIALPMGSIFWITSLACLLAGFGNYMKTIEGYARNQPVVESGRKTQMIFILVVVVIITACALFLFTKAVSSR